MHWENERYVRIYTRDTSDWLALSWDAQAVLIQLLRKVDRRGHLALGKHGLRSVAIVLGQAGLWEARIKPALDELLADGCIEVTEKTLLFPNFLVAQECRSSDAQRKRDQRERRLVTPEKVETEQLVTKRDNESQNVTESHQEPDTVTDGHSESPHAVLYRAVPCGAVPAVPEEEGPNAALMRALPASSSPPPSTSGAGFFAWIQDERVKHGFGREKPLHPSKLSGWYAQALLELNGDDARLRAAYDGFTQNNHWATATPPWPFNAFIANWRDYVGRKPASHAV